jgi:hypothetical protein
MKSIVPVIYANGGPVAGAQVRLNIGPNQWVTATTAADGTAGLLVSSALQDTQFEVAAAGFKPYGLHVNLGLSGNLQLRVGLGADPSRPNDLILPPLESATIPMAVLRAKGVDFVDQSGARVVLNGTDQFMALRQILDGMDITPFITESHDLGFNMWRVFGQGSIAQNGLLQLSPTEGGYYEALGKLIEVLNNKGIYLLFTVFVDNQDIHSDAGHWLRVADIVRGKGVLLSGGNEWSKNGFDPRTLPDPAVAFWSRGSDVGDVAPVQPYGSFAEFHPRRDLPAALMDTVASPTFIYGTNHLGNPLIIDEPPRMGANGSGAEYADPVMCWKFARHYSTECGGAVFHSRSGQSGVLMDPTTRACAEAWSRGMKI